MWNIDVGKTTANKMRAPHKVAVPSHPAHFRRSSRPAPEAAMDNKHRAVLFCQQLPLFCPQAVAGTIQTTKAATIASTRLYINNTPLNIFANRAAPAISTRPAWTRPRGRISVISSFQTDPVAVPDRQPRPIFSIFQPRFGLLLLLIIVFGGPGRTLNSVTGGKASWGPEVR
ncbi:hypothetical protein CSPX01_00978 [Colletotrichum filicis]|nr:hypothetical protein CSPX01_00978 [Colletotrichum filicis]